jgi:very-short-patch-repair endonuclease
MFSGEQPKSALEELLSEQLHANRIATYVRQYRFHRRRWRFDFYFPFHKLAVEIEGGTFIKSGHTTGGGIRDQMEKYNEAAILGIKVLRFDARMILPRRPHRKLAKNRAEQRRRHLDGMALITIKRALGIKLPRKGTQ